MFTQFNNYIHDRWPKNRRQRFNLSLGISHESTQIHALQLRKSKHQALSIQHHAHVTYLALTPTQWGLTQASLAALLPQLPTPTPDIILALPNHLVSHQYLRLEPGPWPHAEQIQAALQAEMAVANVVTDYLCLDEGEPDSSPLYLLCSTLKEAVDHYQQVAQACQLSLNCLDVEAFAALNAWYFWLNQCAPEQANQALAFIHLRPNDVSVYFCQHQRLLDQAHQSLPTETADKILWTHIAQFSQHAWQRFHATHAEAVGHIFVTGRHSTIPACINRLRAVLNAPLTVAHPLMAVGVSPPLTQAMIEAHAPDLLIAFGLALRGLP